MKAIWKPQTIPFQDDLNDTLQQQHHAAQFIALAGGISQSIGIGWAIPDGMVKEPYYYLSFWSEKPVENAADPGQLIAGEWMLPDWNGAVLKHSEIIKEKTAGNQHQLVEAFFKSGISKLMNILEFT